LSKEVSELGSLEPDGILFGNDSALFDDYSYHYRNPNDENEEQRQSLSAFVATGARPPFKPPVKIRPPTMGAPKSSKDFPSCQKYTIDGGCKFGDSCKNSHDSKLCREYYFQFFKKMNQESPVRPSAVLTRSPGDSGKTAMDMSRQSGDPSKIAHISAEEGEYLASLQKRFKSVDVCSRVTNCQC
jgi:hypothetical protein